MWIIEMSVGEGKPAKWCAHCLPHRQSQLLSGNRWYSVNWFCKLWICRKCTDLRRGTGKFLPPKMSSPVGFGGSYLGPLTQLQLTLVYTQDLSVTGHSTRQGNATGRYSRHLWKEKKNIQKGEAKKEHEPGNLRSELSRINENTTEKSHSLGM